MAQMKLRIFEVVNNDDDDDDGGVLVLVLGF